MKPACVFLTLFLFLLAVPLAGQQAVVPEPEKCTVEGLVVKAGSSACSWS